MYKTINGFTKKSMIETIKKNNNGTRSISPFKNAVSGVQTCAYRGENNNKCAVGCFIPDNIWEDIVKKPHVFVGDINTAPVQTLLAIHNVLHEYMPLNTEALRDMQNAHDSTLLGLNPVENLTRWIELNVQD